MRLGACERLICLSSLHEVRRRHEHAYDLDRTAGSCWLASRALVNSGISKAKDEEVVSWALQNEYIVLTFDLDFSRILALTGATGPSVVQIRAKHSLDAEEMAPNVVATIERFRSELETGAIVSLDLETARVRLLPFGK